MKEQFVWDLTDGEKNELKQMHKNSAGTNRLLRELQKLLAEQSMHEVAW